MPNVISTIGSFLSSWRSKQEKETTPSSTDSNNFHDNQAAILENPSNANSAHDNQAAILENPFNKPSAKAMIVDDQLPMSKKTLEAKLSLVGHIHGIIPDPVTEHTSSNADTETYSTIDRMMGRHLIPRNSSTTRSRPADNQNGASEIPETNDKNNSDPVADVSQPNFDLKSTTILASEEERARLAAAAEAERAQERARLAEAKAEAEERARLEAEAKRDEEARLAEAKRDEEARLAEAKAEAEERVGREAEAKAEAEAEERARLAEAEERVRLEAEAERARREEEAKREEEERARALAEEERARLAIVPQDNVTPTDEDESDEEKQKIIKNQVLSEIIDNNALDEKTLAELWADLWEDFSSNQNYTTNDTTNSTTSNNTNDSTSENQKLIQPTRDPPTHEKYTARLTPKTYFGVGIKTELVQEENQPSYLNITQFYDDSGFKSALEEKDPTIKTKNQKIKITAIECDLDGTGKKYYSIDQIFENCGKDEMNFNLKLCDIFRNLKENELKLKFSIGEDSEAQDLNIKKSVFTKGENNEEYKNIKTVIKQQTVTRQQNQTQPPEAVTNPQYGGRPVDNQSAQSVVG